MWINEKISKALIVFQTVFLFWVPMNSGRMDYSYFVGLHIHKETVFSMLSSAMYKGPVIISKVCFKG